MSSLADICTVASIQAALPANGTIAGVDLISSSVTANAVYNATTSAGGMRKRDDSSTETYCNVTVSYTHTGSDDNVVLWYTFPAPSAFQNRFYIGGGGGYTLSTSDPTGGLEYGAVSGSTDVGYGGFDSVTLDEVVLYGNGSLNWQNIYMFSYQALGETAMVGKELAKNLYGTEDKVYTYFEGMKAYPLHFVVPRLTKSIQVAPMVAVRLCPRPNAMVMCMMVLLQEPLLSTTLSSKL